MDDQAKLKKIRFPRLKLYPLLNLLVIGPKLLALLEFSNKMASLGFPIVHLRFGLVLLTLYLAASVHGAGGRFRIDATPQCGRVVVDGPIHKRIVDKGFQQGEQSLALLAHHLEHIFTAQTEGALQAIRIHI